MVVETTVTSYEPEFGTLPMLGDIVTVSTLLTFQVKVTTWHGSVQVGWDVNELITGAQTGGS